MRKKEKKKTMLKVWNTYPLMLLGQPKYQMFPPFSSMKDQDAATITMSLSKSSPTFRGKDTQAYIIMLIFVLWTVKEVKKKSIQKR